MARTNTRCKDVVSPWLRNKLCTRCTRSLNPISENRRFCRVRFGKRHLLSGFQVACFISIVEVEYHLTCAIGVVCVCVWYFGAQWDFWAAVFKYTLCAVEVQYKIEGFRKPANQRFIFVHARSLPTKLFAWQDRPQDGLCALTNDVSNIT